MPPATAEKSATQKPASTKSVATRSTLTRAVHKMPDFIAEALREHKLKDAYDARPPYQRNDYIGWITRAKLDATRQKRLAQMVEELKGGKLYMNMTWSAGVKAKST